MLRCKNRGYDKPACECLDFPRRSCFFSAVTRFVLLLCWGGGDERKRAACLFIYSSTRHSAKIQIRIEKALISVFKHVIIFTEIFNFRGFLCV